jgi:hypothetical protein
MIMNNNVELPTVETRNSKFEIPPPTRGFRVSRFELRISIFAVKVSLLLAVALGLGGWLRPAYGAERVWEKRFQLPPGGHVSVVNVQGSVMVEGWDRAEVEATVAMRSKVPTDQLNDVKVAVEARDGGISFHTLYPAGLDTPIRVDYRLRVPRQIHLDEVSTLQGNILIHDVEGSIEAHNLHGDIQGIDVSGSVVAHALTGNILVSLRTMPDRRLPLQLATINGNVDLQMPARANADLALSTVAGKIMGGFPFQVSSIPGDSTRHAQVGTGGVQVELRTVRGNIRVSQRDDDL